MNKRSGTSKDAADKLVRGIKRKTLYNRFRRWTELGVFDRIFSHLAIGDRPPDTPMIDATHLKAHRTASSLVKGRYFAAMSVA